MRGAGAGGVTPISLLSLCTHLPNISWCGSASLARAFLLWLRVGPETCTHPLKVPWPGHRLGGTFRGNTSWESALGSQNLNPPIDKEASLTTLINLFKQITFCDRPDGSRKAKGDHYFHFKLTSLLIRFWLFMLLGGLCQIRTVCVYLFIYLFICLSVCLFCTWHWNMTDPFTAHLYPNIRAQASQSSMEVHVDTFQPDSSRSDGAARSGLDFLALLNCGKFVSLEGRA